MYVSISETGCKTFVRGAQKKTLLYLVAEKGGVRREKPRREWSVQTDREMNGDEWVLKSKHKEWYYVRLQITGTEHADVNTWKLAILKCLQQKQGVLGEAIEFDILTNEAISTSETIVRVHFLDRVVFVQCIAAGVFDEEEGGIGGRSLRITAQSASLEGVVVPRFGWEE